MKQEEINDVLCKFYNDHLSYEFRNLHNEIVNLR